MKKLEAIIFDMDGVLVDSEPWHYEIESQLFNKLELDVPEDVHLTYVGTAADHLYSDLKKRYNLSMSVPELIEWDSEYRLKIFREMDNIKPNPGLIDLLDEIKRSGLKIGIATSLIYELVEIILENAESAPISIQLQLLIRLERVSLLPMFISLQLKSCA